MFGKSKESKETQKQELVSDVNKLERYVDNCDLKILDYGDVTNRIRNAYSNKSLSSDEWRKLAFRADDTQEAFLKNCRAVKK